MITHIKRSIPDLRTIKHQPLENKESPCGSPKHYGDNGAGTSVMAGKSAAMRGEKETDAITLSAIQTTNCTCCPARTVPNDNTAPTQIEKPPCELDEDDAMLPSNSHHHHYHYHPYQHLHRPQSLHEMR